MNVSGSVTVGYGVSVGGSFNKSNIHAGHVSVNEQAGIYAGYEGDGIDVNHTAVLSPLMAQVSTLVPLIYYGSGVSKIPRQAHE